MHAVCQDKLRPAWFEIVGFRNGPTGDGRVCFVQDGDGGPDDKGKVSERLL